MKSLSQPAALPPGVYFVDVPIAMPPGWKVALHVDADGPLCCVMMRPSHAGPTFVEDSWLWWNANADGPSPASAFPPPGALRLVRPLGAASASGEG